MVFEEMLKEEYAMGLEEGRTAGVVQGRIKERKETLLLFLQNLGTVPEALCSQIQNEQDLEVLKQWTQFAFQSKSVEEFSAKIQS